MQIYQSFVLIQKKKLFDLKRAFEVVSKPARLLGLGAALWRDEVASGDEQVVRHVDEQVDGQSWIGGEYVEVVIAKQDDSELEQASLEDMKRK